MERLTIFLISLFMVFSSMGQPSSQLRFYVGTFTSEGGEGILLCTFDTQTGDAELRQTFKGIDNPSFLRLSPDRKYMYVATRAPQAIEASGGHVAAYKIGNRGNLQFLNKQVSNGADPCHVDVSPDGKWVAIATYGGGTTSVYPVNGDGSLQPALTVIRNSGSGADKSRQEGPHAHSIKFSPFDESVFSADLGTDQLNIYHFENGKMGFYEQKFVKLPPGSGPRHFDFHPNGKVIYVINELNSTVSAVHREGDNWKVFQNVSTLPAGFEGVSYCADIHVSGDGKFLYGSNRGHNSIAVFKVAAETGELDFRGTVPVEGDWPRNFALSPCGKWMLVANQRSHDITVFSIDTESGMPRYTGKKIEMASPVCIEFL